ncbi:hypothetical protein NP233_g3975 [Leucocoprinus birnbaumii]|uniref:DUF6697 domain-containing protein n=1 Tax=Leucocoprinus birnbaumii TaxID=56174 RepID=A0AAD5VVI8_9AGAR|nr:hypothetical protein NP233_g3975 [Leucocoprinus birnbaumii]
MYTKVEPEDDPSTLTRSSPAQPVSETRDALSNLSNVTKQEEKPHKRARLDLDQPTDTEKLAKPPSKEHLDGDSAIKKAFENPKVKIKAEREINIKTLMSRLNDLQHFEIDKDMIPPEIRDFDVPRDLISSLYGGNTQETFPAIAERFRKKHGIDHFMYPNLDYNPACPRNPGAPGLFFMTKPEHEDSSKREKLKERFHRVISRLATNKWLYMGEYMLTEVADLTVSEWEEQSSAFKKTWSREICCKNYGRKVLKRMAARKRFGCMDPEQDQIFAVEDSGEWKKFSPDDVETAFAKGEETFQIWRMVCIGYDAGFQQRLYDESVKKSKEANQKQKKGKGTQGANKSKNARTGKKRKRVETSDSESSDSEPEVEDVDESE